MQTAGSTYSTSPCSVHVETGSAESASRNTSPGEILLVLAEYTSCMQVQACMDMHVGLVDREIFIIVHPLLQWS